MVRLIDLHKFLIPSADEILREDPTGHEVDDSAGMTNDIMFHATLF